MKVAETPLADARVVDLERQEDERGFFARCYDAEVLPGIVEMSVSFNARVGTLRGMHFQAGEHAETKLVRCTSGAIYDVAVDLRPDSPTRLHWHGVELSAENRRGFLIPRGFAHGFQTLTDDSEVLYAMDTPYVPGSGRGVRWNDPAFAIRWPEPPPTGLIISARDRDYPDHAP